MDVSVDFIDFHFFSRKCLGTFLYLVEFKYKILLLSEPICRGKYQRGAGIRTFLYSHIKWDVNMEWDR